MRSGCLNLVLRVVVALIAAVLIVVGAALLFWFAILTLGPPVEAGKVLKVIVAFIVGCSFFLVGRSVWRDLRGRRQPAEGSEDRGSAEDVGR